MKTEQIPNSWITALSRLQRSRAKENCPVANNTRLCVLVRDDDGLVIALRLHATNVVTWYPDGRISLNMGGWPTITTRDRINRALRGTPWGTHTKQGQIYLTKQEHNHANNGECDYRVCWKRFAWHDGLILYPDGTTDAKPRPQHAYHPATPHTNPECGCVACRARRRDYQRSYLRHDTYHDEPTTEDYGASAADGAACRAMATALAVIQAERSKR